MSGHYSYVAMSADSWGWGRTLDQNERREDRIRQLIGTSEFTPIDRGSLLRIASACEGSTIANREAVQQVLHVRRVAETIAAEVKKLVAGPTPIIRMTFIHSGWYATDIEGFFAQVDGEAYSPDSLRGLSVRARNTCRRMNLKCAAELAGVTAEALLSQKNFGVTALDEVRAFLKSLGLHLKGETNDDESANA